MIKKLLSTAALCTLFLGAVAQNAQTLQDAGLQTFDKSAATLLSQAKNSNPYNAASVIIGDTLDYFYNKHFYRNACPVCTQFYVYNSPYQAATPVLTHFGGKFLNSGTITVNGVQAIASRKSTSTNTSIAVSVILCKLTGNQPDISPAGIIDSVTSILTGTAPLYAGGTFTSGPKVVVGDFAIVYRKLGTGADTMWAWGNNAQTFTSTGAPNLKYGEGLGSMRVNGIFQNSTGLWGAGTDREYLVRPMVSFSATAMHSQAATTVCTQFALPYNNTSSSWFGNRQFNLNKFYQVWKPFANTTNSIMPAPDSVYTWDFGDGSGMFYAPSQAHFYLTTGVFTGTLTANYRRMIDNGVPSFSDSFNWTIQASNCGPAGVANYSAVEGVNIYPNPSNSGLVNITNLSNECTIELINMLGQTVSKEKVNTANHVADYSNLPTGSYFLKISSNNEKAKITKLILN